MRVVFLCLGALYKGLGQYEEHFDACQGYVARNYSRLIAHFFVPPSEVAEKASFAASSLVLNLDALCCLPLPPSPPKPPRVAVFSICGVLEYLGI